MVKASRSGRAGSAQRPAPESTKSSDVVSISLDFLYFERDQYGVMETPYLIYYDSGRPPNKYILQNVTDDINNAIILQYGRIMNDGQVFICSVWDAESKTYIERHFVSHKEILKNTELAKKVLECLENIQDVPIIKNSNWYILRCA